jgi:purine catabolism regulator
VAAGGEDLARLVCGRTDEPISENDVHALERAAAVAALLITREEAVTAVENKYQGDFLRDLFLRRAGDDRYVEEHADAFGWDLRRPVVVVVAELDPPQPGEDASGPQRRRWQDRFSAAWRQVTATLEKGVPSVDFSSEVVTLLPVADGGDEPWSGRDAVRRVVSAVAGDKGGGRRPFSVGVSRVARSLAELPDAYAQARRTVQVGRRIHGSGSTTFFDQLGVHRLIALVPDVEELRAFASDVLGPVAEPTPAAADLRAMSAHAAGVFGDLDVPRPEAAVAVGGSAASLRRLVGAVLEPETMQRALRVLSEAPAETVSERLALDPQRVRLLPAGMLILDAAARCLGCSLIIGKGGLREGVLLELAAA